MGPALRPDRPAAPTDVPARGHADPDRAADVERYRALSLWFDQVGEDEPLVRRPGLTTDAEVDVVVVGAGFTGLWTAYHLLVARPGLEVLVLEAETAGFGASGRNGGWCSALFPVGGGTVAREHGPRAALALRAAMREVVPAVGRVATAEGIDCGFVQGGTLTLSRSAAQLARARAEAREAARWGDEVRLLDAAGARARLGASDVLGATESPDCARVQPARLVRGLARAVERRGGRIAEGTRVTRIGTRQVDAVHAGVPVRVRAEWVVRATEAWTTRLPGARRALAPVYSLMVATEPLPADVWDVVGLRRHETFADHRHLIVYGQRTTDDRLAFGGRGAPYHWASAIDPAYDRAPRVHRALERTLRTLLPAVAGARVTHRWGGPLGIARDWHAAVGLDRASGTAWAGGYVGDGVGTSYLAGCTLRDLVLGRDTALTRLPWVGHRPPRWEPEPWRWLGINAGLAATSLADVEERRTGRPSRLAAWTGTLLGR